MPLAAGSRLGPYEILGPIGAGGMGEVYRARDQKLDREVAVKVLPALLGENPDALARFEREAKAVAALSHPNILAIHDFDAAAGTRYAVMELLEGETLREKLASGGAIPLRRAVDYGIQIASGLAAAHDKGIAHRDLKPENLFVTTDGRVKILDFGLARQAGPGIGAGDVESETVSRLTEPGMVLGTVGYMSPEQVRGGASDHRSDIFSFGAVLYEMLTGRRAFSRETAAETLTAILKEEPPELTSVAGLSDELERLVLHCLEKNPSDRFQSARDLGFSLRSLSSDGVSERGRRVSKTTPGSRRWVTAVLIAAALTGGGAVAGYFFATLSRPDPPLFQPLTFRRGHVTSARFTPDGHTVLYGATWEGQPIQAYSTRIGSSESAALDFAPADVLSVSSTGEVLLSLSRRYTEWFETEGRLARAPLSGGAPRELLESVMEASFSPDSELLVVRQVDGKCRLEFPVGNVLYETPAWLSHARVSPSGESIAFLEHHYRGADNGAVGLVYVGSGEKKKLSRDFASIQGLAWHPETREIWFTGASTGWQSALYATTPEGGERLVLRFPGRLFLHDIDGLGRALLASERIRVGTFFGSIESDEERDVSWLEASFGFSISKDGSRVLINEQGEGSGARFGLYLRPVDGAPAVRLGDGFVSKLSPDGRWVLAISLEEPQNLSILPTGAGDFRQLPEAGLSYQAVAWFADGKRIAFSAIDGSGGPRIFEQDLEGGSARPLTETGLGAALGYLAVSPDGRYVVALDSSQRGFLCPTAGGEPVPIEGLEPGDLPIRFSEEGDALFCARTGSDSAALVRVDLATGIRTIWRHVRPRDPAGIVTLYPTDITPDGKHYIYTYVRILSDLFLAQGLR